MQRVWTGRSRKRGKNTLMNIQAQLQKYYSTIMERSPTTQNGSRSDFSRLARRLCGKSVGLVLGGGGARGIAHVGVIKALEEAGVPIDMVGGTSIGSFIGGLYARESDNVAILGRAKAFSSRMCSKWRQVINLIEVSGKVFQIHLSKIFGYHTFALPQTSRGHGWRFIKVVMHGDILEHQCHCHHSYPPLCDNGNLLVDGGYLDNLP
ncbi:28059_t:CDS:2, partial [Racocetra persica]